MRNHGLIVRKFVVILKKEGLHGQRFGVGSNNDVAGHWGGLGLSAGFNLWKGNIELKAHPLCPSL